MNVAAKKADRPYHHGDLRRKLVHVITELIESDGPDGFSVAEAARRAGVSSAAPYKHFKDRSEILHAVVSEAMDRLSGEMHKKVAAYPEGSLEAVAAIGQSYVDFARIEPGIFRVMFGLSRDHGEDPILKQKGEDCFGVLQQAVADYMGVPVTDAAIALRSYMLWTVVHGHSFLEIDGKKNPVSDQVPEWDFLMQVGRGILGPGRQDQSLR